ncbi:hypothetical protein F4804DRAFT_337123 [Jackrogersella minutella]|nr:hypothetical protein F4804DRAFT_337123 [Jackrogersella minutella]
MSIDTIVEIVEEIIEVINDAFQHQDQGRDAPQISGPIGARNIIDTDSVPHVHLPERNILDEGPCGVPKYNFDMCGHSLQGITINRSIPVPGQAQFDGVPPTCMVLSTVLSGVCDQAKGPHPLPCGSACLLYTGLTDEDLDKLDTALEIQSSRS